MTHKVFYEDMLPFELKKRIKAAPIAYLPLGTLERHGEHLPYGTDCIIPRHLFVELARTVGGVVFPTLFIGPDIAKEVDGEMYFGMEIFQFKNRTYPIQHLPGNCYRIEYDLYKEMIFAICETIQRAGFKILVAHGHGPSIEKCDS